MTTKLGLVAFSEGRWDDAKALFTKALEPRTRDFGVLAYRSMTYVQLLDQADADKDYNAALAVVSGPDDLSLMCWAFAWEGIELDRGLSTCDRALAARPDKASYFAERGLVRLRLGDIAGARRDFGTAITKDSDNADAYYGLAIVEHRGGSEKDSARDRDTALAIDPTVEETFCAHDLSELHPQLDVPKAHGVTAVGA